MDEYLETNRLHWDERASVHPTTDFYDVASFLDGRCALNPLEVSEVGDVSGKRLLHLQCHFGLDTLSWARRGADVTGIDFSERSIQEARRLASTAQMPARFIQSAVYDLPQVLEEQFDIVFTSYGALCWLPDIRRWAEIAARYVRPGGFLYVAEIHPLVMVWDDENAKELRPRYPYFYATEPLRWETDGSYAAPDHKFENKVTYDWQHTLGDIVSAVVGAELRLEFLHEFAHCCCQALPQMVRGEDGLYRLPGEQLLPFTFSLKATKPEVS